MPENKSPRIDGLNVSGQIQRRSDLAFVARTAALASSEEELSRKDFIDESTFVWTSTHGFKIGDGDGYEVAVEAEDEAAQRVGVWAGGEVGFG